MTYEKKLVQDYKRWQNASDLDNSHPAYVDKALRIRAWHETYNAAIASGDREDFYGDRCVLAEAIASATHGPILRYHVRVWDDGSYEKAAMGNVIPIE